MAIKLWGIILHLALALNDIDFEREGWRPSMFDIFVKYVTKNTTFINYDSGIGQAALSAANTAKKVFVIELEPVAFKVLKDNVLANSSFSSIGISNQCFSVMSESKMEMLGRIQEDSLSLFPNINPCITLSEFINKHMIKPPFFIKMNLKEQQQLDLIVSWTSLIYRYRFSMYISINQSNYILNETAKNNFISILKLYPVVLLIDQNENIKQLSRIELLKEYPLILCDICDYFFSYIILPSPYSPFQIGYQHEIFELQLYHHHHGTYEEQIINYCNTYNIFNQNCMDLINMTLNFHCIGNQSSDFQYIDHIIYQGILLNSKLSIPYSPINTTSIIYQELLPPTFVTFIMPSIARPSLLTSLLSVISQSRSNWTALVILDGVQLPRWVHVIDPRIVFVHIPKQRHRGMVRNIGLRMARSDWVAFLDDDDFLSPQYIEYMEVEITLEKDLECGLFRILFHTMEIVPPPESITFSKYAVGINFFFLRSLVNEGFLFDNSRIEDYCLLDSFRNHYKKMVISPYINYFTRQYLNIK